MTTANSPVLYIFAISHYCEKARWALDYLGIDYELRHVAPGEHGKIAKKLGAPKTSVPYLALDDKVIQGSGDIVSWAENQNPAETNGMTPDAAACDAIEQRIDTTAGVHVRRYYYSEALVDYPSIVRRIFTRDLSLISGLKVKLAWSKIREFMITRMDLGKDQGQESKAIIDAELEWIDGLLADGRSYLVGDTFSRADLAVASILSPLVLPPEHPVYRQVAHTPGISEEMSAWRDRPSLKWTREIYAKHR